MAKGQIKQKKTEENIQKLIIAIQEGQSAESACAKVGITQATFINWKNDDPDFLKRIEDAKSFRMSIVHEQKRKLILKGYRPTIEKELKSKDRETYGDKQELSGANGSPLTITRQLNENRDQRGDVPGDLPPESTTEALGEAQ